MVLLLGGDAMAAGILDGAVVGFNEPASWLTSIESTNELSPASNTWIFPLAPIVGAVANVMQRGVSGQTAVALVAGERLAIARLEATGCVVAAGSAAARPSLAARQSLIDHITTAIATIANQRMCVSSFFP